ncbi:MAG: hypothetical protein Q7T11_07655 [Deltaproteobacteria bacterium]|nr:hypothetical protein [Deltaproteobacteria bacterium]
MNIEAMGERTVKARLVDILESHQNVKLIAILIAAFAIFAVYFLSVRNKQANERLESQQVILQADSGEAKASVWLGESGPRVTLMDKENPQVLFDADGGKALVTLLSDEGLNRLTLAGGQSFPVLSVFDVNGGNPVRLSLANLGPDFGFDGVPSKLFLRPFEQEGKSGIKIMDESNAPRIVIEVAAGETSLFFFDDEGKMNTQIQTGEGGISLTLKDVNDRIRAKGSLAGDKVELTFLDSLGRKRAELVPSMGAQELIFFDDTQVARESILLGESATLFKILDFESPPALVSSENPVMEL